MSDILTFKNLKIDWFYGVKRDDPELDQVSPQFNILYGPNGSGKTTTAHGFHALLWPEKETVIGRFALGGDEWEVQVNDGNVVYFKDGERVDSIPNLPDSNSRDRYLITLPELLTDTAHDKELAAEIQLELNGGFDVSSARDAAGFNLGRVTSRTQEVSQLRDAQRQVQDATRDTVNPQEIENKLKAIETEINQAQSSQGQYLNLEKIIEFRQQQEKLNQLKEELKTYNSFLSRLQGDELDLLKEIDEKITKAKNEVKQNQDGIFPFETEIKEAGISLAPDELDTLPTRLQRHISELNRIEIDYNNLQDALQEATAQTKNACQNIGSHLSEEQIQKVSSIDWVNDISRDWLEKVEELSSKQAEKDRLENLLQTLEPEFDTEIEPSHLVPGIEKLNEWLRIPEAVSSVESRSNILNYIGLGILFCLILAVGIIHSPLYLILLLAPLVLFFLPLFIKNPVTNSEEPDLRPLIISEYKSFALPEPDVWKKEQVLSTLRILNNALSAIKLKEKGETIKARFIELEKEIPEIQKTLEAEKSRINQDLGVKLDISDHAISLLVQYLKVWFTARQKEISSEEKIKGNRKKHEDELIAFNGLVKNLSENHATDRTSAEDIQLQLAKRIEKYKDAKSELANLNTKKPLLQNQLDDALEEKGKIFGLVGASLDTEDQALAKLREAIPQLDPFRTLDAETKKCQAVVNNLDENIQDIADKDELLLKPLVELETMKTASALANNQVKALSEGKGDLKNQIRAAKQQHIIEDALGSLADAREELKRKRFEICEARIGNILTDYITRKSEKNASKVLTRAQSKLANITQHQYQLQVRDNEFQVFDTNANRYLHLPALSSGTKAQLLIALRTAYVETRETEQDYPKLPLILDEALANSDDARANDIIQAVIQVVKSERRQVFYLTAQLDEVGKWEAALNGKGINFKRYDLPLGKGPLTPIQILPQQAPEVPKPGTMKYDEYCKKLGVSEFNPALMEEISNLDTCHLLDNTEDLYLLRKAGYAKWGSLKYLFDMPKAGDILVGIGITQTNFLEKTSAKGDLLEKLSANYRIGRGNLVDKTIINQSRIISHRFTEPVFELVETSQGSPEKIIEALRNGAVSGFRQNKIDELEEYFKDNNYLDFRPKLTLPQLKTHLYSDATDYLNEKLLTHADLDALLNKFPQ